jgi:hypothetical protein
MGRVAAVLCAFTRTFTSSRSALYGRATRTDTLRTVIRSGHAASNHHEHVRQCAGQSRADVYLVSDSRVLWIIKWACT